MTALEVALALLLVHAALGAFDTFYNHEWVARLPDRPQAAAELALHAVRSASFGTLFVMLAWFEWHGAWGWLPLALIAFEYLVTLADSVVEDRTRKLSAVERVNHMLLGFNAGLYSAFLCVEFATRWGRRPTDVVAARHGLLSWALTGCAVAVAAWAVRDGCAAAQWRRAQSRGG